MTWPAGRAALFGPQFFWFAAASGGYLNPFCALVSESSLKNPRLRRGGPPYRRQQLFGLWVGSRVQRER